MGGSGRGRGGKTPVGCSPEKGIAPRKVTAVAREENKSNFPRHLGPAAVGFKSGHQNSSVSDESSQSRHKITLIQAISLSDS